ncbi:NlpC/P60 family protein [Myxococcus llanfairpwllgwyngyllgogerychwyrndrobwllllantysiliogogogochensis]|uniref:NlpC/P60 family protein n=1 Tax=Myxococcus llanfairpwllgwyngyllgogerychwyrndrobwllllantysiliogogogochensis TaxID=2590453 RepID=A0A540X3V9_9BACT|nr:C40 family peptidase [Myxococcus sp. CA039A]TQF15374.1 NlpC/P60 family protein [Myxococcus llanfairpwllgwyngyllgogerychwyrndrobwllllantysiliogogogochensis]
MECGANFRKVLRLSRLRLLATVPLCALIGCATVQSREVGTALEVPSHAAVAPSEQVVTAPAAEGVGAVTPGESAAEASAQAPTTVKSGESATPEAAEGAPHTEVAPRVVSTVVLEEKERPLVTGVIAAALEAVALVVRPATDMEGFWDAYRTPMQLARLIVSRSMQLVGERNLAKVSRGMPNDCSGFVRLAYLSAGIDLVAHGFLAGENAVSAIFRRATDGKRLHHRAPRPGDLVFFRETYDRNRDGRRNDGMTHVGVVEGVAEDGTVTFIHRGSKGVARSRMNLSHPEKHQLAQGGPVVNDFLRPATKGARAYLTGELFVAFASPDGL